MTGQIWTVAEPGSCRAPTVWRVDLALDEARVSACRRVLGEAERQRADRFLQADDRRRYAVSHAALRLILGNALGAPPASLVFGTDEGGKPVLAGPLAFNLSHSGTIALIGLAPEARIGVDVELVRPIPDWPAIARSHFAPAEIRALARQPEASGLDAFFACWTRKEAFVKALGIGLAQPLDRFAVTLPPEPPALVGMDGWTLAHLDPAPHHVGAVCIERAEAHFALRILPESWTDRLV